MKAKTISLTIEKKMDDWLSSIEDVELAKLLKKELIVTGGCIASMFLQEKVNDYDLYLKSTATAIKIAAYYVDQCIKLKSFTVPPLIKVTYSGKPSQLYYTPRFKLDPKDERKLEPIANVDKANATRVEVFVQSQGFTSETTSEDYAYFENKDQNDTEKFFENEKPADEDAPRYRPVFVSSNAITLSDRVQIVLRFTGQPEDIHKNYDFAHATNYWTYQGKLVTNKLALESLLAKELIYLGSKYPLASIFRTRKFVQREWTCHVGNYLKMALQLNELDLFKPEVLREQLTGVDAAYLHEVLSAITKEKQDDDNFKFNSMYLCKIVDRIMGRGESI